LIYGKVKVSGQNAGGTMVKDLNVKLVFPARITLHIPHKVAPHYICTEVFLCVELLDFFFLYSSGAFKMGKMSAMSSCGSSHKGKSLSSAEKVYKARGLLTQGEKLIALRNCLFDDDEVFNI